MACDCKRMSVNADGCTCIGSFFNVIPFCSSSLAAWLFCFTNINESELLVTSCGSTSKCGSWAWCFKAAPEEFDDNNPATSVLQRDQYGRTFEADFWT